MVSIPALHVPTPASLEGSGEVFISHRKDGLHTGIFSVQINVRFDPALGPYPTGTLILKCNLSDSVKGAFVATSIELVNSYGKHTPTAFITGKCNMDSSEGQNFKGLRFWLMVANNKMGNDLPTATPDVVGFAIHDNKGAQVAYGTGPMSRGNIKVNGL